MSDTLVYECTQSFPIIYRDETGFTNTSTGLSVEAGSLWAHVDTLKDGNVMLLCGTKCTIVVGVEDGFFERHFEPIIKPATSDFQVGKAVEWI